MTPSKEHVEAAKKDDLELEQLSSIIEPTKEQIEWAAFQHGAFWMKDVEEATNIDIAAKNIRIMRTANLLAQREAQAHAAGKREGVEMAAKLADEKAKDIASWSAVGILKNVPLEIRKLISEGE